MEVIFCINVWAIYFCLRISFLKVGFLFIRLLGFCGFGRLIVRGWEVGGSTAWKFISFVFVEDSIFVRVFGGGLFVERIVGLWC